MNSRLGSRRWRRPRREGIENDRASDEAMRVMTTIFRARRIVTMTDDAPEAFAVAGERVVTTGTVAALRERFASAEVVDFGDPAINREFDDLVRETARRLSRSFLWDAFLSRRSTRSILQHPTRQYSSCIFTTVPYSTARRSTRSAIRATRPIHPAVKSSVMQRATRQAC